MCVTVKPLSYNENNVKSIRKEILIPVDILKKNWTEPKWSKIVLRTRRFRKPKVKESVLIQKRSFSRVKNPSIKTQGFAGREETWRWWRLKKQKNTKQNLLQKKKKKLLTSEVFISLGGRVCQWVEDEGSCGSLSPSLTSGMRASLWPRIRHDFAGFPGRFRVPADTAAQLGLSHASRPATVPRPGGNLLFVWYCTPVVVFSRLNAQV